MSPYQDLRIRLPSKTQRGPVRRRCSFSSLVRVAGFVSGHAVSSQARLLSPAARLLGPRRAGPKKQVACQPPRLLEGWQNFGNTCGRANWMCPAFTCRSCPEGVICEQSDASQTITKCCDLMGLHAKLAFELESLGHGENHERPHRPTNLMRPIPILDAGTHVEERDDRWRARGRRHANQFQNGNELVGVRFKGAGIRLLHPGGSRQRDPSGLAARSPADPNRFLRLSQAPSRCL